MNDELLRLAILALAAVCLSCIGGVVFLQVCDKEAPDFLATIAGLTSGAIVGILVPKKF